MLTSTQTEMGSQYEKVNPAKIIIERMDRFLEIYDHADDEAIKEDLFVSHIKTAAEKYYKEPQEQLAYAQMLSLYIAAHEEENKS